MSVTAILFLEFIFHLLIKRCLFQLMMQHLAYFSRCAEKGLEKEKTFENLLGTNLEQIRNFVYRPIQLVLKQ